MDSGWAVVLGAAIGLIGSALLPWVRDATADRRRRTEEAASRRREAMIELLTANAALSFAVVTNSGDAVSTAFERRSRAEVALLLELGAVERRAVQSVLAASMPVSQLGGAAVGHRLHAVQTVLTEWARDDLGVGEIEATFKRLTGD